MRTLLIVFHRWLALVTSVLIIVVGVTGSALVFEGAIDRGLNPNLWRVTLADSILSLDTLVAHARAAASQAHVSGLTISPVAGRAYVAQADGRQIFVEPYSGRVVGTRDARTASTILPRRLHLLHTSLMSGDGGSTVVALVTIASLVLVLTGIIIWWNDKLWRINWSASWKRIA